MPLQILLGRVFCLKFVCLRFLSDIFGTKVSFKYLLVLVLLPHQEPLISQKTCNNHGSFTSCQCQSGQMHDAKNLIPSIESGFHFLILFLAFVFSCLLLHEKSHYLVSCFKTYWWLI